MLLSGNLKDPLLAPFISRSSSLQPVTILVQRTKTATAYLMKVPRRAARFDPNDTYKRSTTCRSQTIRTHIRIAFRDLPRAFSFPCYTCNRRPRAEPRGHYSDTFKMVLIIRVGLLVDPRPMDLIAGTPVARRKSTCCTCRPLYISLGIWTVSGRVMRTFAKIIATRYGEECSVCSSRIYRYTLTFLLSVTQCAIIRHQ